MTALGEGPAPGVPEDQLALPEDPFTLPAALPTPSAPASRGSGGYVVASAPAPAVQAAAPAGLPADPFALPSDPFSVPVGSLGASLGHGGAPGGNSKKETVAFPRLQEAPAVSAGEVVLEIHQRKAADRHSSFQVQESEDGTAEIPLNVCSTKVGAKLKRDLALKSPWLTRCLSAPVGESVVASLALEQEEEADTTGLEVSDDRDADIVEGAGVMSRRLADDILEIILPCRGIGQRMLTPRGLTQTLELCADTVASVEEEIASTPVIHLLTLFLWAAALELPSVTNACRSILVESINFDTVVPILALGHVTGAADLLHACYWVLRDIICRASGAPPDWVSGKGQVRLGSGHISHNAAGARVPLSALAAVLQECSKQKIQRWQVPFEGYTLCKLHRHRADDGNYPHRYELRLDHSDEVLLTAMREDEQSACRIFEGDAASEESSEHSEQFVGSVKSNFWGTKFTVYDSGTDRDALYRQCPAAMGLPLRQKAEVCKIGYDTNIMGDCPRKVTVEFNRGGEHYHMENLGPRWDAKLGSYALPFFGRVKKASAKNFQLVINNDANTIYLMFGKISKDVFCLDYRAPLTHLDAMAIAITALAKKRAVS